MAVARYRMIRNDPLISDPPGMGASRVINAIHILSSIVAVPVKMIGNGTGATCKY